jgi:hypothetical protein
VDSRCGFAALSQQGHRLPIHCGLNLTRQTASARRWRAVPRAQLTMTLQVMVEQPVPAASAIIVSLANESRSKVAVFSDPGWLTTIQYHERPMFESHPSALFPLPQLRDTVAQDAAIQRAILGQVC